MLMLSVVIPTFNEEEQIARTISSLLNTLDAKYIKEVIVSDGGSSDRTAAAAIAAGARVIYSPRKGRAEQMNFGALHVTTDVIWFVHADSLPQQGSAQKIMQVVNEGISCGCLRLRFDVDQWFLTANAWFTRFDVNSIRFGDQSLFVKKDVFNKAGKFDTKLIILEDQEIIGRLKRLGKFTVLPFHIVTSARKYRVNGIYRTQFIYYLIYVLYRCGYSQQKLVRLYKRLIRQDKI